MPRRLEIRVEVSGGLLCQGHDEVQEFMLGQDHVLHSLEASRDPDSGGVRLLIRTIRLQNVPAASPEPDFAAPVVFDSVTFEQLHRIAVTPK